MTLRTLAAVATTLAIALWLGCEAADSPQSTASKGSGATAHDTHGDGHGGAPEAGNPGNSAASSHAASSHAASSQGASPPGAGVAERPLAGSQRPAAVEPKLKFKSGAGETLYSIKWKDDGAKLVDGEERELCRYNVDGPKIKLKSADDTVLGYLVGAGDRIKVEDASQQTELLKLIRQEDGDWKVESVAGQLIGRIKVREYGAELESADDASVAKVKRRDGKTSLRDSGDQTVLYTNDPALPLAVACLGLSQLDLAAHGVNELSLPVRAGLLVRMTLDARGQAP